MKKYIKFLLPLSILCNIEIGMCVENSTESSPNKSITDFGDDLIFEIIKQEPINIQQLVAHINGNVESLFFRKNDLTALHHLIISKNYAATDQVIGKIDDLVLRRACTPEDAKKILNSRTFDKKYSPLHIAIENTCLECTEEDSPSFLIATALIYHKFTDLNLTTRQKQTPLDMASRHQSECQNPFCKVKIIAGMLKSKKANTSYSITETKSHPSAVITKSSSILIPKSSSGI